MSREQLDLFDAATPSRLAVVRIRHTGTPEGLEWVCENSGGWTSVYRTDEKGDGLFFWMSATTGFLPVAGRWQELKEELMEAFEAHRAARECPCWEATA